MALIEEAHKAARILLDQAYVRILARDEADAVCAAAILAHSLRRESVDFHISFIPRITESVVEAIEKDRPDALMLVGLAGDAVAIPAAARRIILDASPAATAAVDVEARVHSDASLASLAHMVAAGVSKRNVDLAPLALAGTLAGFRHIGGLRSLDAEILQEAIESSVVLREPGLALDGTNLVHALSQLDSPYVPGITGRARSAKNLASELGLTSEASPRTLEPDDASALAEILTLRLLAHHAPDAALDALFRPRIRALQGPCTGLESGEMARLAEAACAQGEPGLALTALWPDTHAAGDARAHATTHREELVASLLRAERDAPTAGALFVVEAPRAALCRPLADRVALSLAAKGTTVVVHAPTDAGAYVAIRAWGRDAAALARSVAEPGDTHAGAGSAAHLFAADASRVVKAIEETLAEAAA